MNAARGFAAGLVVGVGASYVVANIAIRRFFAGINAVNESINFYAAKPEHPRLRLVGGDS
ncbi:hypothetical protein [Mycolicibacter minnesotensis]